MFLLKVKNQNGCRLTLTPALASSLLASSGSNGEGIGRTGRSFVLMPRCCRDMCECSEFRLLATVPHRTHRYLEKERPYLVSASSLYLVIFILLCSENKIILFFLGFYSYWIKKKAIPNQNYVIKETNKISNIPRTYGVLVFEMGA